MPYMITPNIETPLWYGVKLVKSGELVLVNTDDVTALLAEGWTLGTNPEETTTTICASEDDET
jgi:hypothetical protein